MKRILLSVIFLLYATNGLYADFGKSGWPIFLKPQPAKFNLLSLVSYNKPALVSILYNPSVGIAKSQREFSLFSEIGFAESKLSGIVYTEPLTGGVLTIGMAYYNAGKIELNWIDTGEVKSRNVTAQSDMLGCLAYSFKFDDNVFMGAALKGATSEIAESGSSFAVAVDIGTFYIPTEEITISCALQNIGSASKFNEKSDLLPVSLFTGVGYRYNYREYCIMPAAGFTSNFVDSKTIFDLGAEFSYDIVSLNLGYRVNIKESNIHLGANIEWEDFNLGYAFLPGNYLEDTHRINLGYKFGSVHTYDNYDLLLRSKGLSFD